MSNKVAVGLSFAAGLVGGALVFRIQNKRRLLIEYKERSLDGKIFTYRGAK